MVKGNAFVVYIVTPLICGFVGVLLQSDLVGIIIPTLWYMFGGFVIAAVYYPEHRDHERNGNLVILYGFLAGISWIFILVPTVGFLIGSWP